MKTIHIQSFGILFEKCLERELLYDTVFPGTNADRKSLLNPLLKGGLTKSQKLEELAVGELLISVQT